MGFVRGAACACGIVLALCAVARPADCATERLTVRQVRCWTFPDHTRVVLDMSGAPRYRIRTLSNPYRIVVEIPGCKVPKNAGGTEVRDGVLDRVRVNRVKTGVEIVLDVPRKTEFNHFLLPPRGDKPNRIVIDLAKTSAGGAASREPEQAAAPAPRPPRESAPGEHVVVIDPGHGGDKPGTISRNGLQEKALVMKLARMLKESIERETGYRAILVRNGDYDVPWYQRVAVARENGADVFVSLHFNANADSRTRGIELYFLSLEGASDENAEAVAEQENLLLAAGADSANFNDDLKSIIVDASRSNALQRSSLLADEVAAVVRNDAPIPFRKVRQANFIVLRGMVPSILVEGGYLSNRADANLIGKESYLRWLAQSLASGIVNFIERYPNADTVRSSR